MMLSTFKLLSNHWRSKKKKLAPFTICKEPELEPPHKRKFDVSQPACIIPTLWQQHVTFLFNYLWGIPHHRGCTVPLLKSSFLDSEVDSCNQVQTDPLDGWEDWSRREEGRGEGWEWEDGNVEKKRVRGRTKEIGGRDKRQDRQRQEKKWSGYVSSIQFRQKSGCSIWSLTRALQHTEVSSSQTVVWVGHCSKQVWVIDHSLGTLGHTSTIVLKVITSLGNWVSSVNISCLMELFSKSIGTELMYITLVNKVVSYQHFSK